MDATNLTGLDLMRANRGAMAKAAKALGLSRSRPYQWEEVPAEAVVKIEEATGLPRERLRPDLYREQAT